MKLVVGLGNPGRKYEETRHNAGFLVVDYLAHNEDISFYPSRFQALLARMGGPNRDVFLVKPQTYMNLSGLAVKGLVQFYKLDPKADLLVISDDLDLPLGKIRFRTHGSHGGQRGLLSIINELSTDRFCRLRLGIGRPAENRDAVDHVISAFNANEEAMVDQVIIAGVNAVRTWLKHGPEMVMNRYNNFDARDGDTI